MACEIWKFHEAPAEFRRLTKKAMIEPNRALFLIVGKPQDEELINDLQALLYGAGTRERNIGWTGVVEKIKPLTHQVVMLYVERL